MVRIALLAAVTVILLTGCEELVETDDEPPERTARCDTNPDWYINLPIVELREGGQMNPPLIPDPDDPGATDADWSDVQTAQVQRDLFATGLLQEDNQKWGVELFARPELPRLGVVDPAPELRQDGCLGLRLEGRADTYYPRVIQERPLRLVQ